MRGAAGLFAVCLAACMAACAGSSGPDPAAPAGTVTPASPAGDAAATECAKQLAPRSRLPLEDAAEAADSAGAASSAGTASAAGSAGAAGTASAAAAASSPVSLTPPVSVPSRLIVEARLPLATLTSELERSIAPVIAEGKGVRIGAAGALDYSVERGAFSASIAHGQLIIETPLAARAQACAGRRCYASCEPRALARATLPLWLTSDYRFDRSHVALEFTRGCRVRALGGLLSVDVTPLLKGALAPQLDRVGRQIDDRLPDVRADVARAWRQLSRPRPLPLGGCVTIDPLGLVQGPMHEAAGMAHARFALLARPELHPECSSQPIPNLPLPPLSADPALPDEDSVTLGMQLPLASLARAFETAPPAKGLGRRFHVENAALEARGPRVTAELTLAGEICGAVTLDAELAFAGEEGFIELTAGKLADGDNHRVRQADLDPTALADQLTRLPRVAAPLSLPLLRLAPTALAALFSDPDYSLVARISSMQAAGADTRGDYLIARVQARGNLLLEQK